MALPTKDELTSLEFLVYGAPTATVSTIYDTTPTLETLVYGAPFWMPTSTSGGAPTYNATQFFMLF